MLLRLIPVRWQNETWSSQSRVTSSIRGPAFEITTTLPGPKILVCRVAIELIASCTSGVAMGFSPKNAVPLFSATRSTITPPISMPSLGATSAGRCFLGGMKELT